MNLFSKNLKISKVKVSARFKIFLQKKKKGNTKKTAYIRLEGNSARQRARKSSREYTRNEGSDVSSTCVDGRVCMCLFV